MPFDGLQDYLAALEKRGELRTIDAPVDPELEITEIADRVVRGGRPGAAVHITKGRAVPVRHQPVRHGGAHGVRAGRLQPRRDRDAGGGTAAGRATQHAAGQAPRPSPADRDVELGAEDSRARALPAGSRRDPAALRSADSEVLAPGRGPLLTLPLVFTRHPETGQRNVGMYRMQVYDDRTTGMHWHPHKVGAQHYREYEARGSGCRWRWRWAAIRR